MSRAKHLAKFKYPKGVSGNPEGARAHSPELKKIKNLTEQELVEAGSLILKSSVEELRALSKDDSATPLRRMIASVAIRTIAKGDPSAFDALLNRLVGKVKDVVQVDSNNVTNLNAIVGVVDEDKLRAAIKKVRNEL